MKTRTMKTASTVRNATRGLAAVLGMSSKLALGLALTSSLGCWGFDVGDVGGPGFPGNSGGPGFPSEQLSFRHEVFELDGGVATEVFSGCDEVPSSGDPGLGFGFGKGPSGDAVAYSVDYSFSPNTVDVRVRNLDTDEDVVDRSYDEEFLLSGELDETVVELAPGFSLLLIGQGVESCGSEDGLLIEE